MEDDGEGDEEGSGTVGREREKGRGAALGDWGRKVSGRRGGGGNNNYNIKVLIFVFGLSK